MDVDGERSARNVETPSDQRVWLHHRSFCSVKNFCDDVSDIMTEKKEWTRFCSDELECHPNVFFTFDRLRHIFDDVMG